MYRMSFRKEGGMPLMNKTDLGTEAETATSVEQRRLGYVRLFRDDCTNRQGMNQRVSYASIG